MPEVRPIDANRFIKYLTAKKKVCEEFNDRTGVVRYQVAIDETKKLIPLETMSLLFIVGIVNIVIKSIVKHFVKF